MTATARGSPTARPIAIRRIPCANTTILPDDTLYAVDTYKFKAVFIGNARDGKVIAKYTDLSIAEGLAVDPVTRTLYTGEVRPDKIGDTPTGSTVRKLVRLNGNSTSN